MLEEYWGQKSNALSPVPSKYDISSTDEIIISIWRAVHTRWSCGHSYGTDCLHNRYVQLVGWKLIGQPSVPKGRLSINCLCYYFKTWSTDSHAILILMLYVISCQWNHLLLLFVIFESLHKHVCSPDQRFIIYPTALVSVITQVLQLFLGVGGHEFQLLLWCPRRHGRKRVKLQVSSRVRHTGTSQRRNLICTLKVNEAGFETMKNRYNFA